MSEHEKLEDMLDWLDDGSVEGHIIREHVENMLDGYLHGNLSQQEAAGYLLHSLNALSELIQHALDHVQKVMGS